MKGISLFLCDNVVLRGNSWDIWNPWLTYAQVITPLDARICAFAHVAFEENDQGDHVAKLVLVDPDKKETVLTHTSVVVEQERFDWRLPMFANARIEKTGLHRLVLKIDKKKAIETPLWILPQKGSKGTVGFQSASPTVVPASTS